MSLFPTKNLDSTSLREGALGRDDPPRRIEASLGLGSSGKRGLQSLGFGERGARERARAGVRVGEDE